MFWCCSSLFVLSNSFKEVDRSGSLSGINLRIAVSTGLMNLACSEMNMENSANCVIFLTDYADFVVFLILTAAFCKTTSTLSGILADSQVL